MIGERLFDLRKDAGLTQDQLGDILKINKHSISSYERDKSEPPDEIKIQIAKYFNVSIDYLLGMTDIATPYPENSGYFQLPKGFPASARKELKLYAEFLIYKYKNM